MVRFYRERYPSQQVVDFFKRSVNGEGLFLYGRPPRLCAAERPTEEPDGLLGLFAGFCRGSDLTQVRPMCVVWCVRIK